MPGYEGIGTKVLVLGYEGIHVRGTKVCRGTGYEGLVPGYEGINMRYWSLGYEGINRGITVQGTMVFMPGYKISFQGVTV